MRDHFRGALLGTFVGDALGMPLEGQRPPQRKVREMLEARRGRGTYTDDTQLMIGLAEGLLDAPGRVSLERIAERFAENYQRDRGYGGNTAQILTVLRRGISWREAVAAHPLPGGSYANGAAMRVAPVALAFYPDRDAVARAAEAQAEVTGHTHPEGCFGARVQALAVLEALQCGIEGRALAPETLLNAAAKQAPREFASRLRWIVKNLKAKPADAARRLGTGSRASRSVPMALWSFLSASNDAEEAIVRAVNAGGDTDTIGAMSGALAGAYHGASGLPGRWVDALEERDKGRTYVLGLADRLSRAVRQP
jgi:poly(ADP-ribose) glycohydrolase ARH3